MIDLGVVKGCLDVLGAASTLYVNRRDRTEAASRALRLLQVEVAQNLAVLDSFKLSPDDAIPANRREYLLPARAIRTEAHLGVLLVTQVEDDPDVVREQGQQRAALLDRHLGSVPLTIEWEGQVTETILAEVDDELRAELRSIRDRKTVGFLEAASKVVASVGALQALAALPDDCEALIRAIRPKIRLRTIREYERAISLHLRELEVIPRIRP